MTRIAHVDVKRIFGKAEENEIPAQIELGRYDFFHWRSPTAARLYLIFRQQDLVRGIAFDVSARHDRQVPIQCELCLQFLLMTDSLSIRSVSRVPEPGVAYKSRYSFICADTETCHARILRPKGFRQLLSNHADALEVVSLVL